MLWSNFEYISLRLLRRTVFRDSLLLRLGGLVPYYRTNLNQSDPTRLVDQYARFLALEGYSPKGKRLLEIGVGRTNSVSYEISARFAPEAITSFEPYVKLAQSEDTKWLSRTAQRHDRTAASLSAMVQRHTNFNAIADGSIDLVLSGSVLEHVSDPCSLFSNLDRVLAPNGVMLHLVDYRDHFFKYPYHFLQFRKEVWNRWLNPGDFPGWRVYDHLEQLAAAGFSVQVLAETQDANAFAEIAEQVSQDYRRHDERLKTTTAALWASRRAFR
jgi:SAM-dependent methyltransferase